ncbi:MAG: hypothetical protein ACRDV3_01400 [Acidothermaceae bacterium]
MVWPLAMLRLLPVVVDDLTYGDRVGVQQPELERSSWSTAGDVKHGYPPPRLSVGSVTTAYCGEPMVVEGAVSDQPPRDACPLCALAWRSRHRNPLRP